MMLILKVGLLTVLVTVYSLSQSTEDLCEPPCLYATNITSIFRFSINSSDGMINNATPQVLHSAMGHIRSIEVDSKNRHLYWGDFRNNSIKQSSLNGTGVTTLFSYAIGYPQGLAVDWSSNILYWTDSLMKMIELSDTRGNHRKVLFKLMDEDEPRGLFANPIDGHLFWTDWGKKPKIERSSLAGNDRKTIVDKNLLWPNDLAVDYQDRRLFWIDAGNDVVGSIDFDGSNRRTEYKLELTFGGYSMHPYSIAYLIKKRVTYLSDWNADAVIVYRRNGNISTPDVVYKNSGKRKNIGQIRISSDVIENATTPCLSVSNQCSHLCLKNNRSSHICACPTGMKLKSSNSNECEMQRKDYEMYFADSRAKTVNHLIKYVDQEGFTVRPLVLPTEEILEYPVALDYDPVMQYIYWTDRKTQKTYQMKENGTHYKVILKADRLASFGLAIDKVSQVLYWFGEGGKTLMASTVDGRYTRTVLTGLSAPRDIVLHEEMGYIYFSEYKRKYIGRVNFDGTGLIKLLGTRRTSIHATGLAIDKTEGRLFWCDYEHYSIESCDLDLKNRKKIIQKTIYSGSRFWLLENYGQVISPFGIAVLGEKLFWSDLRKAAIYVADKRSGGNIEYVTGGLDHPRDLHVFRDKPEMEYRKIYRFSFSRSYLRPHYARCYGTSQCVSTTYLPDPAKCPLGYKQTKFKKTCSNCSDAFGANFKCPCNNWKTCAQRAYGDILGCHKSVPYMKFKVRECVQAVKPGTCGYKTPYECPRNSKKCISDDDCNGSDKCCNTACGFKCSKALQKSDHPCSINNGGCSHFCLGSANNYQCACPNHMILDHDGERCLLKNDTEKTDVCALLAESGPCQPFVPITKWYFNQRTKLCETFNYGGCQGNRNRFDTKEYCQAQCGGICPTNTEIGTCEVKPKHCANNSICPGKQLCCNKGCGSVCVNPVNAPSLPKCLQPSDIGICKASRLRWYYDVLTKKCRSFKYGGCGGNENNFPDETSCYKACRYITCHQPRKSGPCEAATTRYYYDNRTSQCEKFIWGGCQPNDNNFKSYETCVSYCINDTPDACTTLPCKNGATCTPTGKHGDEFKCECKGDWIGKTCDLNANDGSVKVVFENTRNKEITSGAFQRIIALYFTKYCTGYLCAFKSSSSSRTRRRSPLIEEYIFMEEDVKIKSYAVNQRKEISFSAYILKPDSSSNEEGYMTRDSAISGFKMSGQEIADVADLTFISVDTPKSEKQGNKEHGNVTRKVLIALFLVVALLLGVIALALYIKRRNLKQRRPSQSANTNNDNTVSVDGVHCSFENKLYDDLHGETVTLPPVYSETQNPKDEENHVNEHTTAAPLDNINGAEANPTKQLPLTWVKFEDEKSEKLPISDFVEAKIGDPYNIEEDLPSQYVSQLADSQSYQNSVPLQQQDINLNDGEKNSDC